MGLRRLRYAGAATMLLVLAGCGDSSGTPNSSDPTPSPDDPTTSAGETPGADSSAVPVMRILDWRPANGGSDLDVDSVEGSVWTLSADGRTVFLGGTKGQLIDISKGSRVSDLLLDESHALIVQQDRREQLPAGASLFYLDSDERFGIGPNADPPTVNGGTWALGEGKLFHATYGPKNAYCLAEVDLASQDSAIAWCAPENHGFNDARITPAGLTVLSFTLGKDGCRTPVSIAGGEATPLAGVTECIGWDSLLTRNGQVWSETPDANRIEEASFFARTDERTVELGTGDTGSLTWCGDAAYFTQQPQRDGDPARLLRWTADAQLEIVYETPGSPGFISEPRCGGSRITITAKSEGGDEQVSAPAN